MAVVGEATVRIRAISDKFKQDLRRMFSDAESEADKSGDQSGSKFSSRFGSRLRDLDRSAEEAFGRIRNRASGEGDASGSSFTGRFGAKLRNLDRSAEEALGRMRDKSGKSGDDSGSSFTSRFGARLRDLDRSAEDALGRFASRFGDSGDDSGRSFFSRFRRSSEGFAGSVVSEAETAGDGIGRAFGKIDVDFPDFGSKLGIKILALVPLIGVLGGAIAGLIGGLTAMAAAATYAAGAISILASAGSVVVSGLVTGMLAFQGIGGALSAMGAAHTNAGKDALAAAKAQKAAARQVEAAEDRVAAAHKRVAEAQKSLARTIREVAQQGNRDRRSITDAEGKLAEAQQKARQAQLDLTRAREDAKEKLEDLQLSLRGATLGEEEAQLRLRRAQQEYNKVLNDASASSDDRDEARLNLEEAELALDQAKDRREDVTKQTEAANKAGIEGSAEVVDAKKNIDDANKDVADSEQSLADARQKAADDAVDGADRIAQAQSNLADAQQDVTKAVRDLARAHEDAAAAMDKSSTSANKLKAAMAALSPQAQEFVKYLYGLKPVLNDLKTAAGEHLFGPLTTSLKTIVTNFLPTFRTSLSLTGMGLGRLATAFSDTFKDAGFLKNFGDLAKLQVPAFELLGKIGGNALRGVVGLARAAFPTFMRFLGWIEKITGQFAGMFSGTTKNKDGETKMAHMTQLIKSMGEAAATIGKIFGGTFGIIGNIFKAALPSGLSLNHSLLDTVNHFKTWTGTTKGQARMREFFEKTAVVTKAVGKFIAKLVKEFLKLGEDNGGGIKKTFDAVTAALPSLMNGIRTFTNEVAPPAIKVITDIVRIFEGIVSSKSFHIIVGMFSTLAGVLGAIGKVLFTGPLKEFSVAIIGTIAAIALLIKTISVLGKLTGIKAALQLNKISKAPVGTGAAKSGGRAGGFLRGVRGNDTPDEMRPGKNTRANAFGQKLRRRRSIASPDEYDPELGTEEEFEQNRIRNEGRKKNGKRKRRGRRARGETGSGNTKLLIGVGATAAIGLALAPAIMNGKIPGLGKAGKAIADVLSGNMDVGLALAAVPVVGGFAKKISGALNGPQGDLIRSAGSAAGDAIKNGAVNQLEKLKGPAADAAKRLGGLAGGFAKTAAKAAASAASTIAATAAQKAAAAGAKIFAAAQWLVNAAMSANPIMLIVIGLAALVAGLIIAYKRSETFRKIVHKAMAGVAAAFKIVMTAVKTMFGFVKKHWDLIVALFFPGIGAIILVFRNFDKIKEIAGKVLDWLKDKAGTILGAVLQFFKDLPGKIWNTFVDLFTRLGTFERELGSRFRDKVGGVVSAALQFFKDLPGKIWSTFTDLFGRLGTFERELGTRFKDKVKGVIEGVVGFFKDLPGKIIAFATGVGSAAGELAKKIASGLKNGVSDAIEAVVGYVKGIPDKLKSAAGALLTAGQSIGKSILHGMSSVLGTAINFVKAPVNAILDAIRGILSSLGKIKVSFDTHIPGVGKVSFGFPDLSDYVPHNLARGAVVLPRPGGTLVNVGEAGRSEAVVDEGLLNARLRTDARREVLTVEELRRIRAVLERMSALGGVTVENLNVPAGPPGERVAESAPRALRNLAFELGA